MTHACVNIQIAPESVPSIPSWFGEVAVMAQVLTQFGLLKAIQQDVRFARARFGRYEVIDFVAVMLGYALSGEPTLEAFYRRLAPFAIPFLRCSADPACPIAPLSAGDACTAGVATGAASFFVT